MPLNKMVYNLHITYSQNFQILIMHNIIYILAIQHCLGNNYKKKVYTCSVQTHFFPNVLQVWLAEFLDMECTDIKGQL
jgi:hypothetical protein